MKRVLLIFISIMLVALMVACDTTPETSMGDNSKSAESGSDVSDNSKDISGDESKEASGSDISGANPDEIIETTFSGISVHIIGTDALEKAGYEVEDDDFNMTVDLTVKGKRAVINELLADSFKATIDVSGVSESGKVEFLINYELPEGTEYVDASESFATIKIKSKGTHIDPQPTDDVRIAGSVLIVGTRAMEQFGGSASGGQSTAAKLNEFKSAVGSGVNVYVLVPPLSSAYYAPTKYPNSIKNHQNCFYGLRDALVDVEFVDVLGTLAKHVDEDIYPRTEHHWNALAAYYAAEEFSKVAGTPFDNLSTFEVYSIDGVLGSYYNNYSNHDPVLKANPDTFVWYVPTRTHTVEYLSRDKATNPKTGMTLFSANKGYTKFIYGDSYTTHITSNIGNGRKLLVFKDSFGNALAPFLVSSYDEVYIADYRYFTVNAKKFIEEKGITDVCFAISAFGVAGKNRDYITKLLHY